MVYVPYIVALFSLCDVGSGILGLSGMLSCDQVIFSQNVSGCVRGVRVCPADVSGSVQECPGVPWGVLECPGVSGGVRLLVFTGVGCVLECPGVSWSVRECPVLGVWSHV